MSQNIMHVLECAKWKKSESKCHCSTEGEVCLSIDEI